MFKYLIILVFYILLSSCSNETIYSGKILNQVDLENINFKNKETLLSKMGNPSFIDPVENKYFYFSEKKNKKSIFRNEVEYSYIFVFKFDKNDKIESSKVHDLKNIKDTKFIEEETENLVVKRGLIERIFGGVGPQEIPTSP